MITDPPSGKALRIHELAQRVPTATRTLADIGCDHGLLPLAVLYAGRAQRCIATELTEGRLDGARRRIARAPCARAIELRCGDGLAPLASGEADVICIAGMGPRTIESILDADWSRVARPALRLILNPLARDPARLLDWLRAHELELTEDIRIDDRNRSYRILVADA